MNDERTSRTPVFVVNRTWLPIRADLVEAIANHLDKGEIVRVEDSEWPASERLRYIVRWVGEAGHVFDGRGDRLGVFADLEALVQHAEMMTA